MNTHLLNLEELANFLRISKRHLQVIRKDSSFPNPVLLGQNKVCYLMSDIQDWICNGGVKDV